MESNKVFLKEIEWPEFGIPSVLKVPEPSLSDLEKRLKRCREMMESRLLTHLVVYGDKEHFGNLMYLTHFDPKFEEALLIIGRKETPLILVGNECGAHLSASPLYNNGRLRQERYQSFSLVSQPRENSRPLRSIFLDEGIDDKSRIGCAGWKYFTDIEFPEPEKMIEIPSFVVETLRSICGYDNVVNSTDMFLSPVNGLKTECDAGEIAFFEYSNIMASEGMKNLIRNFRYDISDFELIREYKYTGYPLSCHIGMKSSGNQKIGLSGPCGAMIKKGEPFSSGIAYWGSNICRAGWVAADENDLPPKARDYIEAFAGPYFYACSKWYENLKPGTRGSVLQNIIDTYLPFDKFSVFLNPGHLIHYEEWISSPVYKNSDDIIRSGMYMQADIIPRSPVYGSSRMEEGIIIADATLQNDLKAQYPDVYARCMKRRDFMTEVLGFRLPSEVLPLSNIPGIVTPFFLNFRKVLSLKK